MPSKTILNVQILRLLAASMVLFGHIEHEIATRPAFAGIGFQTFDPVFWPGGVDIFFIISGFIIHHLGVSSFGKPGATGSFLVRRIIRVAPPYWLFTLVMVASIVLLPSQLAHTQLSYPHLLASFLFFPVQNPYGSYYPVLILGWTLNFEMMFYVLFGVALRFRRPVGIAVILAGLVALGTVGVALQPLSGPFGFWSNSIVFEFIFGIGLSHARLRGIRVPAPLGLVIFLAGVALAVAMELSGVAGHYWIWRPLWMGIPAFLICAGPSLIEEDETPSRLKKLLARGGDCSFALYLSHPFSIGFAAILFQKLDLDDPWVYVAGTVLVAAIAAVLVHDLIERPMTRMLLDMMRLRAGRVAQERA